MCYQLLSINVVTWFFPRAHPQIPIFPFRNLKPNLKLSSLKSHNLVHVCRWKLKCFKGLEGNKKMPFMWVPHGKFMSPLEYSSYLRRHKVTWALFYRCLSPKAMRHLFPIPLQPLDVIIISIEEVYFASRLLNAWVQIQHFEERSSPTFSHANDEALRWTKGFIKVSLHIGS